jgi:PQQ-like domain
LYKSNEKALAILTAIILTISIGTSMALLPQASAQTRSFPTLAFINVAPNPVEVGQTVTVNFWLAVPLQNVQFAHNMTVVVTKPDGTTETLGPFTSDFTGGTTTSFIPDAVGNYTFQFFYGGETLGVGETAGFTGDVELPSQSSIVTLVVTQSSPASYYPITPLPTSYWQTPVNAENVQNWYNITGPWLGLAANAFGSTGAYNDSGNYNPYTMGPTTAHVLWTKPWAVGGVAGGDAGGSETSNYWSTSQYEPKWNPVVMDGIEYSTWYTTTTGYSNGIVATNLYNGQTMWVLNTTNPLVGGMQVNFQTVNQYGVVGPYIITTGNLPGVVNVGGEYNLYDALTGTYVCSIVNGTTPGAGFAGGFMTNDVNGNWVGYYVNSTFGRPEVVHPAPGVSEVVNNTGPSMNAWNMTQALGLYGTQTIGSQWTIRPGSVFAYDNGLMWSNPSVPSTYDGNNLGAVNTLSNTGGLNGGGLSEGQIASNVIVLTYGFGAGINGATSVGESPGWAIEAGFSQTDGSMLWIKNQTETPFTRISENFANLAGDGVYVEVNMATFVTTGYSLNTGKQVWQNTLTVNGETPNSYDVFGIQAIVDPSHGIIYLWGLGGDIWAVDMSNGNIIWSTSTTTLQGTPGYETPYAVWPIWVQYGGVMAGQNNVLYLSEGHEYSPPLFHGAQQLAINATNGQLLWSVLGFDDTAGEVSYGIMTTFNSYDSQVYAYGQGPTSTTVDAPQVGVTSGTPVTIRGTVMDVSAGATQQAVAANFPNGLPAVSDDSQSQWMEYVYMQQPCPNNVTGVPVTLTAIDPNGNLITLGSTTSDASGMFTYTWTPPAVPGSYTITANFAGSGAYYPSSSETSMYVGSAAGPAPTAVPPSLATTQSYVLDLGIATIIVVIIIGAVLAILMMRKR